MQFLTTVITLFAMCGAALAGPVAEHGTLQDRSVPMFEYCDLDGGCSLDYDDNVNICGEFLPEPPKSMYGNGLRTDVGIPPPSCRDGQQTQLRRLHPGLPQVQVHPLPVSPTPGEEPPSLCSPRRMGAVD